MIARKYRKPGEHEYKDIKAGHFCTIDNIEYVVQKTKGSGKGRFLKLSPWGHVGGMKMVPATAIDGIEDE